MPDNDVLVLLHRITNISQQLIPIKKEQDQAIRAFVEGSDVFISLPTGYGKSITAICTWISLELLAYRHSRRLRCRWIRLFTCLVRIYATRRVCARGGGTGWNAGSGQKYAR